MISGYRTKSFECELALAMGYNDFNSNSTRNNNDFISNDQRSQRKQMQSILLNFASSMAISCLIILLFLYATQPANASHHHHKQQPQASPWLAHQEDPDLGNDFLTRTSSHFRSRLKPLTTATTAIGEQSAHQTPKHHILSQDHVILNNNNFRSNLLDSSESSSINQLNARNLLLYQQQQVKSEADIETIYIRKGANGTLPCLPVQPGDSQATMNKIEWYKEDKKLVEAEAKRIVVWNTKTTIAYLPETGALLFRTVTNEDSGEYHCLLTKQPSAGSAGEIEDGVVRFYVQDVPDPPQQPIVDSHTHRSVNLSWVPSFDYHYSPILHYVIHQREGVGGQWDVSNGVMTPDNRTQFEIIGLKPFTSYSFRVLAVNAIGVGEPSPESHFIKTLRRKPDSRLNIIGARNVSSTSIKLEWLPPSKDDIHGEFLGYRIRYVNQFHEHAPPIQQQQQQQLLSNTSSNAQFTSIATAIGGSSPSNRRPTVEQPSLDGPFAREIIVGDPSQTAFVVKNLNTFTPYKFSVQVMNPAGDGPVAEAFAMTDEGVPSPPMNLAVTKIYDTLVKLRWQEPKSPNGILQGYQIQLFDVSNNLNETRKLPIDQSIIDFTLSELNPFTWYKAHVQAFSRKFLGESSQVIKFRTDVSGPSPPQYVNVTCYGQDSILIQWQRPEKFYNQLDYYYVLYKIDSAQQYEETTLLAKKDKLINELLITNLTAEQLYELKVLAGTKSILDPNHVYKSDAGQTLRVVLQANCESYTAYPVTENTFHTSLIIGIVCAAFALVIVTAALFIWRRHCQAAYYYLDDPQTASRGTNSPQLSETYDDTEYGSIPVNEWDKHVKKLHADGDIGFTKEFEQIQNSQNPNLTYEHSQLPENKHKNRYINIVAYDHTRVTLRQLPGQKKPGSDYINANYIDGYNKPRAYIGTQGPSVSTFHDYWRMIWEQKVVIIVMITNLQERGRRKCDMYWPKEGSETYGYIRVKLLQEVVMATYTLRTFTVKNLKIKKKPVNERTVYQYHYTNWPDHGVPDHPLPVLSFVRKSTSANPPGAGPIICHCSAGCGRSGTYIVIDAMLKQIRHRQSIDVVDFLKHIRSQRNYLVQTEEQYIFIHDALVEAIESGETEIASHFIGKYIQLLQTGGSNQQQQSLNGTTKTISQKNSSYSITSNGAINTNATVNLDANNNQQLIPIGPEQQQQQGNKPSVDINNNNNKSNTNSRSQSAAGTGQWSLLERQYRLVASFKAKDFNVASALKPYNHKSKNRNINFLPLEGYRVHITPKPCVEGSDYINATFLEGFNNLREFIVTQHPLYQTFSNFWQMVYDHNSQTIVLLTQMSDQFAKEFPQFWPQKEDEVDYGSFKVKLIEETTRQLPSSGKDFGTGSKIVTRDFIMRSNQDDYELQTRIIHCPGWPECCGPLSSVFDLIQVVQQTTQQQASQQKMHDGLTRSTTVTIGQEHEPQNGGPIIVVDKYGGTEAATFAVLTTLFKQINFEDAVNVFMYAKLAHQRRPGIWTSQDDYLFLYRAIESYHSSVLEAQQREQQQQQRELLAGGKGFDRVLSTPQFHNQTMTLDRHKANKQSFSSTSTMLRSKTLRKENANNHANNSSVVKGNNPLIEHHHNGLIGSETITTMANGVGDGGGGYIDRSQNNMVMMMNASSKQLLNATGSPYNSAISIGTSPHQHLLAGSNSRNSNSLAQQQQQQQQQFQQQSLGTGQGHYLYPAS